MIWLAILVGWMLAVFLILTFNYLIHRNIRESRREREAWDRRFNRRNPW